MTIDELKKVLADAFNDFIDFLQGLAEIRKEKQEIVAKAIEKADTQKVKNIYSKINNL